MPNRAPSSNRAEDDRRVIRDWIEAIERKHNLTRPQIAKRSRVSPSTIYRWFDDKHPHVQSYSKVRQIAEAFGAEMPGIAEPQGFSEGEAAPYEGSHQPPFNLSSTQSQWSIATRALELAGILPGDIVLIDQAILPRSGDAVVAQVYNLELGSAETKMRLFEPPYLTTRTMDPASIDRPIYIDNERAIVMGTVINVTRIRTP